MMSQQKLFPVSVVGSWTRPEWLVQALRRRQAGELSAEDFNLIADDAALAAIKYQEDAGVDHAKGILSGPFAGVVTARPAAPWPAPR